MRGGQGSADCLTRSNSSAIVRSRCWMSSLVGARAANASASSTSASAGTSCIGTYASSCPNRPRISTANAHPGTPWRRRRTRSTARSAASGKVRTSRPVSSSTSSDPLPQIARPPMSCCATRGSNVRGARAVAITNRIPRASMALMAATVRDESVPSDRSTVPSRSQATS